MQFVTKSEKETFGLAKQFSKSLRGGEVVLLLGDLGSGKTTFVKGLAQALGIKEKITSPTFVLMHTHCVTRYLPTLPTGRQAGQAGKLHVTRFVHVDAYRLKTAQGLLDIGLGDWLGRQDTTVLIEWGEKIKPLLRRKKIKFTEIKFQHGQKENERIIKIK